MSELALNDGAVGVGRDRTYLPQSNFSPMALPYGNSEPGQYALTTVATNASSGYVQYELVSPRPGLVTNNPQKVLAWMPTVGSNNFFLLAFGAHFSAVVAGLFPTDLSYATNVWAADQAKDWFSKARTAARANNLRAAYRSVYRGLEILLLSARWRAVAGELDEICSIHYPASFGIGAMRFVSDAASRIPRWNLILGKLRETAQRQGLDPQKVMRGLVETNGSA